MTTGRINQVSIVIGTPKTFNTSVGYATETVTAPPQTSSVIDGLIIKVEMGC